MLVTDVQPQNVSLLITVTSFGIVIPVNLLQLRKALSPILVTLSGIVIHNFSWKCLFFAWNGNQVKITCFYNLKGGVKKPRRRAILWSNAPLALGAGFYAKNLPLALSTRKCSNGILPHTPIPFWCPKRNRKRQWAASQVLPFLQSLFEVCKFV